MTRCRVLYCERCQSLRYHMIKELKRANGEVFFEMTCTGLPPVIPPKIPRLSATCGRVSRHWIPRKQWDYLVGEDLYCN